MRVSLNKLSSCQFTNFIVKNAARRAKFSSGRRIGKVRNALTAAQKSSRGNFPHSLPAVAAVLRPPVRAGVGDIPAAAAPAVVIDSRPLSVKTFSCKFAFFAARPAAARHSVVWRTFALHFRRTRKERLFSSRRNNPPFSSNGNCCPMERSLAILVSTYYRSNGWRNLFSRNSTLLRQDFSPTRGASWSCAPCC